jgi:hypothetical protein
MSGDMGSSKTATAALPIGSTVRHARAKSAAWPEPMSCDQAPLRGKPKTSP